MNLSPHMKDRPQDTLSSLPLSGHADALVCMRRVMICIAGHSSYVFPTRGDKPARPQLRPGRLEVAVVQSTGDGGQVKVLHNRAEVGTIWVAVVHQGFKRSSHTHVGTAGPGESMLNTNLSAFGATGLSPLSASAGALQKIVRRCAQLFESRAAGREAHDSEEACLVLYCKLPGGVIMASPLGGPAFCLRKDVGAVERKRSVAQEERTDGVQQVRHNIQLAKNPWSNSCGHETIRSWYNRASGSPAANLNYSNDTLANDAFSNYCVGDDNLKQTLGTAHGIVLSMYIRPTVTASTINTVVLLDLFDTLKSGTKAVIPWLLA